MVESGTEGGIKNHYLLWVLRSMLLLSCQGTHSNFNAHSHQQLSGQGPRSEGKGQAWPQIPSS